jgi:gas vesicle protein
MNDNKRWSELSENLEEVTKKIKSVVQEDLVDDLKESMSNTINSTAELIKNIIKNVDSTVKDDDLKKETKELLTNISEEFKISVNNLSDKVNKLFTSEKLFEEE